MPRDPTLLLEDMLVELRYIEGAVAGKDIDDFLEDRTTQKAVERALEVLGEAAKAVSADVKARHPEIPWPEMMRTRDFLIHAYHRIEPPIVWRTATEYALPLLPAIEAALARERRETR